MGWYVNRVLPRIMNKACDDKNLEPYRARTCAGLKGDVVEIGFGSGLNVQFYPADVTKVAAVEPSERAWRLADKRLRSVSVPVHWSGLDGQALPFPDESYDAALSTMTLCTIPDLEAALAEVRRVLKPGGALHFMEHGIAPDEKVRRWQYRLDPLEKRFVGGCHLTRPIDTLLRNAGFTITELDRFYGKGAPKVAAAMYLGVARI